MNEFEQATFDRLWAIALAAKEFSKLSEPHFSSPATTRCRPCHEKWHELTNLLRGADLDQPRN